MTCKGDTSALYNCKFAVHVLSMYTYKRTLGGSGKQTWQRTRTSTIVIRVPQSKKMHLSQQGTVALRCKISLLDMRFMNNLRRIASTFPLKKSPSAMIDPGKPSQKKLNFQHPQNWAYINKTYTCTYRQERRNLI